MQFFDRRWRAAIQRRARVRSATDPPPLDSAYREARRAARRRPVLAYGRAVVRRDGRGISRIARQARAGGTGAACGRGGVRANAGSRHEPTRRPSQTTWQRRWRGVIPVARYLWLSAGSDSRYLARSEEHTSELQSLMRISYAVFCLKKKNLNHNTLQQ